MSEEEGAEKSHEPSQRKLEKAREKGEVPRSTDLMTTMVYLGILLVGLGFGARAITSFADALVPFLAHPDRLAPLFFRDGAPAVAASVMRATMVPIAPLLLVPGLLVLLLLLGTRTLLFTPSKLVPKFSRLSPIEGAKNKFGRKGLFEFSKSFVKLLVYSCVLAIFLATQMEHIVGMMRASPAEGAVVLVRKMMRFLTIVVVIAGTIGMLDFFFQHAEHIRKNRMTHKEMRDEFKESEGDPYMKQQRRQRAQEIAMRQMMQDVPDADVVIVNPTHYAVVLKWSRAAGAAPVCVAKGQDEVALKIREIASEAGVPIRSDPPTARALHATTRIGDEIAPEHYEPVAAAIRFAEDMRRRARERGWG